jgi:hypothetical protein
MSECGSGEQSLRPRRTFLKRLTGGSLALLASRRLVARPVPREVAAHKRLPTIRLGDLEVSRLIAGGNPMGGYAYSTSNLSRFMQEYYTPETTADFLLDCEEEGITAWQSHYSEKLSEALILARDRGSRIKWIALIGHEREDLGEVLKLKPAAVAHHGGVTDRLMRSGKQQQIHDFVKRVKDAGLPAGVSTHSPQNLRELDQAGWENDFFMGCFYYLSRSQEELRTLSSEKHVGYAWIQSDPERMTSQMSQVQRPCLGFKILGAGRLCGGRNKDMKSTEQAFAFAFERIKPSDGVIVGMFPVYTDEVAEDAGFARKHAMPT